MVTSDHLKGAPASSRSAATRQRLLEAAVSAFARKGFHGTTTRDIAALAGMSPAALYVHHRSKEELLYLISHSGHELTLDLVREAIASADRPTDQLIALVRAFAAHHARGHTSARIVNYELSALSSEHLEDIRRIRQSIEAVVRALVDRGQACGEFHVTDTGMTAVALLSLGIDIARWYNEDGRLSPEEIAAFYAGIALRIAGVAPGGDRCGGTR